jgi:hypothetical protein
VRADLGDPAVRHDHDAVRPGCGGEAVRDDQGGAPGRELLRRPVHLGLGGQVQGGGRLVEQQDRRVDQVGPGQRDELPLAGRQVTAPLGDAVPEPAGQPGDPVGITQAREPDRVDLRCDLAMTW